MSMFIKGILFKIFKLSKYKNEHAFENLEGKKKNQTISFLSLVYLLCVRICHFLWKYYLIIGSLIPLQKNWLRQLKIFSSHPPLPYPFFPRESHAFPKFSPRSPTFMKYQNLQWKVSIDDVLKHLNWPIGLLCFPRFFPLPEATQ